MVSDVIYACVFVVACCAGATGCELILDQPNRGCYAMTQQVSRGNFAARHYCWVFSKCAGTEYVVDLNAGLAG